MADDPHAKSPASATGEEEAIMEDGLVAGHGGGDGLRCCCGREHCVFLKHNCSVLESVEKDVHTAAKLGQALLARHEAYMASAERDRTELTARIEQLEMEKADLEASNARKVEENRQLLDQLELLNGAVGDSDTKIRSLEATLQSTHQTIRRLEGAAARAEDMERHIAVLEQEQLVLRNTISFTDQEARNAMQRWRKAELRITDMQEQLEKMEKEAHEERERHVEVLGRMERQRAVEKDLDTAAGRLKGAAAAKTLNDGKNGSSVVSHFVRDLLQDNATLQLGIAELRELLASSNDEIQLLREQLLFHQPLRDGEVSAASTLRAELTPAPDMLSPQNVSQELHIHHHYHVSNNTKAEAKKPKKKRQSLTPGIFTPPALSSPSSPSPHAGTHAPWLGRMPPAASARSSSHVPRDSTSTISMPSNRWSLFSDQPSDFAPSSVPSSPQTNARNSMFDPSVMELSLPTSPTTSVDPLSPTWRAAHRKQFSEASAMSIPAVILPADDASSLPSQSASHPWPHGDQFPRTPTSPTLQHPLKSYIRSEELAPIQPVPYDPGDHHDLTPTATSTDESANDTASSATEPESDDACAAGPMSPLLAEQDVFQDVQQRSPPALRRTVSHESIMSLSNGMDIHTLKARPSQLTLRPLGATAAGTGLSAVTALPTMSRVTSKRSSVLLRDNFTHAGLGLPIPAMRNQTSRIVSTPVGSPHSGHSGYSGNSDSSQRQVSSGALGRLVAWRPWGGTSPVPPSATSPTVPSPVGAPSSPALSTYMATASSSSTATTPKAIHPPAEIATEAATAAVAHPDKDHKSPREWSRAPGINQPGSIPIPGFYEYWAAHQRRGAPSKVNADRVDRDALREVLEE